MNAAYAVALVCAFAPLWSIAEGPRPGAVMTAPRVFPYHLAVSGSSIYWTDFFGQALYRAPAAGGTSERLLALDPAFGEKLREVVADDAGIYIATTGTVSKNYADGRIMRLSLDGKTRQDLATGLSGIAGLAHDAGSLYWTTQKQVMKVAKRGGNPIALVTDETYPKGIAVDADAVYWASGLIHGIRKLPHGQSTPVTLADRQDDPDRIALAGNAVYWTNQRKGYQIRSVEKSGGHAVRELARSESSPSALAVGDGRVFWTTVPGRIWRYTEADHRIDNILRVPFTQYDPVLTSVIVHDRKLYWIEIERKALGSADTRVVAK